MEERPWADYRRGKPIDQRGLAVLLRHFGISSKDIRTGNGDERLKGYMREQFEDAFRRYLAPSEARQRDKQATARDSADFASATGADPSRDEESRKPASDKACRGVADENTEFGGGEDVVADFEVF